MKYLLVIVLAMVWGLLTALFITNLFVILIISTIGAFCISFVVLSICDEMHWL